MFNAFRDRLRIFSDRIGSEWFLKFGSDRNRTGSFRIGSDSDFKIYQLSDWELPIRSDAHLYQIRKIEFSSKDGVKTLSSKLKTNDKLLNVSGKAGTMQTEGENVELGTEREVLEQSKVQSKTISAPSDFYVSHDYGKKGEIPQGSMRFQSMESGKK